MTDSFQFRDRELPRDQTHVMGILNVTPDSFSDGGQFRQQDQALRQAELMVEAGAVIVDVGGESTRPGAAKVSLQEEMDRVLPVIEALSQKIDCLISVDTSTPGIMTEAAKLGAHLINDVRALQRPDALPTAAKTGLPICLMHMQGQPDTMQSNPHYADVITEVRDFFTERVAACHLAGIDDSRILLDPGFGFGKTIEHNLALVNRMSDVSVANLPLLVGMSRKSMIGTVLDKPVEQRLNGTLALTAAAVLSGAFIVRVHDVEANVDVVRMLNAVKHERMLHQ